MAPIEQCLRLGQPLPRQLVAVARGRWRKKCLRSGLPILFYVALYRSQRHPEGPHDLALGRRAVDDELAGEQPETPQILRLVGEDRQMAVKVDHLGITALESQFRCDQGRPFREHG